jgi:ABC-type multidrug transport system fused ATPase/permease subunit
VRRNGGWSAFHVEVRSVSTLASLAQALALEFLLQALDDGSFEQGVAWAAALAALGGVYVVANTHSAVMGMQMGMRARTAATAAIHAKLLRSSSNTSRGTVSTLVGTDAGRLVDIGWDLHSIWAAPLYLVIAVGLTWRLLGVAILPALGVALLLLPVTTTLMSSFDRTSASILKHQQRRMTVMSEIVGTVLGIKLFGWEGRVARRVAVHRTRELKYIRRYSMNIAGVMSVAWTLPTAMTCAAMATYALMGGKLTSSVAFPALFLLDSIVWPMLQLPWLFGALGGAIASMRRVKRFITAPEVDAAALTDVPPSGLNAVSLESTSFRWPHAPRVNSKPFGFPSPSPNRCCGGASVDEAREPLLPAGTSIIPEARAPKPVVLCDVSLTIPTGQLVAVVGPVGSGKSSLLVALLGELEQVDKGFKGPWIRGRVAYVPQSSWIRSNTLRANVEMAVSGSTRDYATSVRVCCLEPDLESLAQGDATEVGESGVSLSGGQKARVTLARAVRSGADVYLLDDPLSAVDAHVGSELFHTAICSELAGTTRVLVTHQLQFLPHVDRVLVMERGRIVHDGTFEELVAAGVEFASLLESVAEEPAATAAAAGAAGAEMEDDLLSLGPPLPKGASLPRLTSNGSFKAPPLPHLTSTGSSVDGTPRALRSPALVPMRSLADLPGDEGLPTFNAPPLLSAMIAREISAGSNAEPPAMAKAAAGSQPASLMEEEERYSGTINSSVYLAFASSLGGWMFAVLFGIASIVMELCNTSSGAWLALWSDAESGTLENPPPFASELNPGSGYWVTGYLLLGIAVAAISLGRNLAWFNATYKASKRLHERAISALLRAPVSFWHSTPSGRILNRLSRDLNVVDQELPDSVNDTMLSTVDVIARIITIAVAAPIFLVVFLPVGVFYYQVARYYRASSRELKRLEAIASSPLQSRFSETVDGLVSVRAYRLQREEAKAMEASLDASNTVVHLSRLANRWVSIRVEGAGVLIVAVVSCIAVLSTLPDVAPWLGGIHGLLALALTYAMNLTGSLAWLIRVASATEAEMARVERLYHFAALSPEAPLEGEVSSVPTAEAKPHTGVLEVDAKMRAGVPDEDEAEEEDGIVALRVTQTTARQESDGLFSSAMRALQSQAAETWAGTEEHRRRTQPSSEVLRPPAGWPSRGDIEFRKCWMRYRPDLEPVLRGLSIVVPAGTRVGIVGRTGAGKSSFFAALLRTVELCRGSIVIDGLDTSRIGLHHLRRGIASVPQDPVMWSGTLRQALDPNGPIDQMDEELPDPPKKKGKDAIEEEDEDKEEKEDDDDDQGPDGCVTRCLCGNADAPLTEAELFSSVRFDPHNGKAVVPPPSDEQLLLALKQVGLGEWVETFGLDGKIEEGGSNLSLGTRQLLALARALLSDTHIVVLDEATASVSPAEDNVIQKALRTAFAGRTILTVAHRLPTIIEYDRVLVMDRGRVAEWGSPAQLLRVAGASEAPNAAGHPRVTGQFASMVAETGEESALFLTASAKRCAGLD